MLSTPRISSKFLIPTVVGMLLWAGQSLIGSEELEHFEKKIRPLFENSCIECHGPQKQMGALRLDTKAAWQKGGNSGPLIIPGDARGSQLIKLLDGQSHPEINLSEETITDLEIWIQIGAPDPRNGKVDRGTLPNYERGKDFWSFQPIKKSKLPQVKDSAWPRTEIDTYIRAAQESRGYSPVPDAGNTELARRIYFNLIGLPPTPEQIDAFVSDNREDAFEYLVDELLASPHFGERWGRHWLDVARFAESSGGGKTVPFKDAWRYRDYIIEAFNTDMPYDVMVREQLAGDLLPYTSPSQRNRQLTATAFLALGPTNFLQQNKIEQRWEVIDEQIDTLGKAFMGMTIGCARCHDHKFDPIPTSDYYAMAGIFKSTQSLISSGSRWLDTTLVLEGKEAERMAEAEAKEAEMRAHLSSRKDKLKLLTQHLTQPPPPGRPKKTFVFPGIVLDDSSADKEGEWTKAEYSQNFLQTGYYQVEKDNTGKKSITFKTTIPFKGRYEVRLAYPDAKNRSTKTQVTIGHSVGESLVLVNQQQAPEHWGRFHTLGEFSFDKNSSPFVRVSNEGSNGLVVADAVQWFLIEDQEFLDDQTREAYLADLKKEVKSLEAELKSVSGFIQSRPLTMSVKERDIPSDAAIRIRGVERDKGEIVPRGFLSIATLGEAPKISEGTSGRKELAEWITHPDNPLTARVMANRIWTWLFGTGIVRSVDNFGTTGETPSHPELLDYLALRLQEKGWSIKALVKEIILSRTWQLSTRPDTEAAELDPDNRLLTSYPLRRLDAEQLRDAILAVNQKLDMRLYGPNMEGHDNITNNAMASYNVDLEYNYVFKDTRRSVYTPAFRVTRHELFELFDFGNANFTMGNRNVSTVALQALYMLNNPFVVEQSRHAAELLLAEIEHPEQRIDEAFRRTLGRTPSKKERQLVTSYLQNGHSTDSVEDWGSVFQILFGSIDFRYLN